MATTRLMTADDLWELEDSGNCRRELIRGELREMAPPGEEHSRISTMLAARLWILLLETGTGSVFGEASFVVARDPDIVLIPDVAFISAGQLPADRDQEKFIPMRPDLAIEVVSPSDRANDVTDKVLTYLDAGVLMVWVVYPSRRIVNVHRPDGTTRTLTKDDELDGGDLLPGFRLAVSELFA